MPVRALEGAKTRLGPVLDETERRALVTLLLRRTVGAARSAPGVTVVAVVSPDPEALALADALGAEAIAQRSGGLNPGLGEAREALAGRADRLLVLPADIPGISADAIGRLLALADTAQAGRPAVVLAPDRHGRGTNALLLDPPDAIDPAFGGDSRSDHARRAAAAGAALLEAEGLLGLDVDTPDDLLLAQALSPEAVRVP